MVGDLGDRAHGAAWTAADALLLDRDRGRETLDRLDLRTRELVEELARVGREALDIAPLSFGVDRVEGEAGLTRAGGSSDDDEAVARNVEVDVLEVVGARAAQADLLGISLAGQSRDRFEVAGESADRANAPRAGTSRTR
jgi:hypothetical protein